MKYTMTALLFLSMGFTTSALAMGESGHSLGEKRDDICMEPCTTCAGGMRPCDKYRSSDTNRQRSEIKRGTTRKNRAGSRASGA